jgi:hypothetical protein
VTAPDINGPRLLGDILGEWVDSITDHVILGPPCDREHVLEAKFGKAVVTEFENGWQIVGGTASQWEHGSTSYAGPFVAKVLRCPEPGPHRGCLGHEDRVLALAQRVAKSYKEDRARD